MFGEKLKALRKKRNLTQAELAKFLHVSKSLISKYESPHNNITPSKEILFAISDYFNVEIRWLLSNQLDPNMIKSELHKRLPDLNDDEISTIYDNLPTDFFEEKYDNNGLPLVSGISYQNNSYFWCPNCLIWHQHSAASSSPHYVCPHCFRKKSTYKSAPTVGVIPVLDVEKLLSKTKEPTTSTSDGLNDAEKEILMLFRDLPPEKQKLALRMIEAALSTEK